MLEKQQQQQQQNQTNIVYTEGGGVLVVNGPLLSDCWTPNILYRPDYIK